MTEKQEPNPPPAEQQVSNDIPDHGRSAFWGKAAYFLVEYRNLLFIAMVLGTLGMLVFAPNVKIDNSLELWFLESDEALTSYRDFKKIYGNDEIILAMVDCRDKQGFFNQDTLNAIFKASRALKEDKENFKRVLSVGVAPHIDLRGTELTIEDLMTGELKSPQEADEVKRKFLDDPLKTKLLTDLTRKYAVLLIEPVASPEMDKKRPTIIQAVKNKLENLPVKYAGMGIMYDELNQLSLRDGFIFTSLSYIVIILVIILLFRSWIFSMLTLAVMVIGTLNFIGVYGFFRQNFNMVTVVLPTLMLILSISDVSYVFNNYCFNIQKVIDDKKKGLISIFSECLSPCLFTSLTNFFGFISIVTSPMEVLRGFGYFAAFSTMAEYIVSMISAAFILALITPQKQEEVPRPFAGYVEKWVRLMPRYHKVVMALLVFTTAVGLYGISILEVDTYSMGFLHQSNLVRSDSDEVEKVYGNYLPLEIRLITGKDDGIKDPDFMKRLSELHDEFEKTTPFQKAASIVDVLKRLNQVMSDGASSSYRVPDSFNAISQLLMFYESDPKNDLEHMTDKYFTEARLTVRVPMVSASNLKKFEETALKIIGRKFAGTNVKIVFGGYVPLYARLIGYITQSQVSSFGLALIFIFGTMAVLFKNFDAIWLGIIPNVYPIIMTMGMMGYIGIRLDVATVTIASIALGVAVDDTIHELFLFFEPSRRNLDPVESISECLIEAGPAVVSTSLIYALGFSALAFASIKSVIYFGGLLALTLVFGMFSEITIMPAIICYFRDYLGRSRFKEVKS